MNISRRKLAFCILAVLVEQMLCAPLIETTGRVTPRIEDATVKSTTEERNTRKEIDDENGAANYLKKFGYSNAGISKNSHGYRDELKESIKRMQKFFKLNVTGELDNDTLEVMNSPRCALPDVITGAEGKQKRFTSFGKWPSNTLTYRISNYPSTTIGFNSREDIESEIDEGLKIWTRYANLNISKSKTSSSNFNLAFYKGNHGDGDPFDGKRGTLAHAFFPKDGRLHYDDDETWSNNEKDYNLKMVTTHEGGHVLGLGHSNDFQSVMYPTYKYLTNFKLGDDDIKGIQYLYGNKLGVSPVTTTTPTPWYKNFNFFRRHG